MAKTAYTRESIAAFVKNLDTRAREFDEAKIDDVINRGYAELTTVSKKLFSNEEVLSLDDYYEASEEKFTLDIEEDVTEVYDIYVTIEGNDADKSICQDIVQGIGIYRNSDLAYRDNRYVGRCHVDLDVKDTIFDSVVMKYYYTPKATTETIYMDSQVHMAFQDAMWAALNYFMKDVESEAQKRASMTRTSKSTTQEPEDIPDMDRAMFGGI